MRCVISNNYLLKAKTKGDEPTNIKTPSDKTAEPKPVISKTPIAGFNIKGSKSQSLESVPVPPVVQVDKTPQRVSQKPKTILLHDANADVQPRVTSPANPDLGISTATVSRHKDKDNKDLYAFHMQASSNAIDKEKKDISFYSAGSDKDEFLGKQMQNMRDAGRGVFTFWANPSSSQRFHREYAYPERIFPKRNLPFQRAEIMVNEFNQKGNPVYIFHERKPGTPKIKGQNYGHRTFVFLPHEEYGELKDDYRSDENIKYHFYKKHDFGKPKEELIKEEEQRVRPPEPEAPKTAPQAAPKPAAEKSTQPEIPKEVHELAKWMATSNQSLSRERQHRDKSGTWTVRLNEDRTRSNISFKPHKPATPAEAKSEPAQPIAEPPKPAPKIVSEVFEESKRKTKGAQVVKEHEKFAQAQADIAPTTAPKPALEPVEPEATKASETSFFDTFFKDNPTFATFGQSKEEILRLAELSKQSDAKRDAERAASTASKNKTPSGPAIELTPAPTLTNRSETTATRTKSQPADTESGSTEEGQFSVRHHKTEMFPGFNRKHYTKSWTSGERAGDEENYCTEESTQTGFLVNKEPYLHGRQIKNNKISWFDLGHETDEKGKRIGTELESVAPSVSLPPPSSGPKEETVVRGKKPTEEKPAEAKTEAPAVSKNKRKPKPEPEPEEPESEEEEEPGLADELADQELGDLQDVPSVVNEDVVPEEKGPRGGRQSQYKRKSRAGGVPENFKGRKGSGRSPKGGLRRSLNNILYIRSYKNLSK